MIKFASKIALKKIIMVGLIDFVGKEEFICGGCK